MTIKKITVLIRGVVQTISFERVGNIWYLGGNQVDGLEDLRKKFRLDEGSITMLVLKYGTPKTPYRRRRASPYTPRNLRRDLAKSARLKLRSLWPPYHA